MVDDKAYRTDTPVMHGTNERLGGSWLSGHTPLEVKIRCDIRGGHQAMASVSTRPGGGRLALNRPEPGQARRDRATTMRWARSLRRHR